ncbi:MAG: zinc ribbon domain-containing protein [Gammaproteobacteria bacterium]
MPIYEYRCKFCGHQFEELQKPSDSPLKTCPKCSKKGLQKLITPLNFKLKGSGWYKTDYTKDTKKPEPTPVKAESTDKDPSKKPEKEDAKANPKTTETKPAEKTAKSDKNAKS